MKTFVVILLLILGTKSQLHDPTTREFLRSIFNSQRIHSPGFIKQILSFYSKDPLKDVEKVNLKGLLSSEAKDVVQEIIDVDRANHNVFEAEEIDDDIVAKIGAIAPILGSISNGCLKEVKVWIITLMTIDLSKPLETPFWALKFIDFSGKIPDGILADYLPNPENLPLPFGNTVSIGRFDACLGISHEIKPLNMTIKGRYTYEVLEPYNKNSVRAPKILPTQNYNLRDFTLKLNQTANSRDDIDKLYIGLLKILQFRSGICSPASCTAEDLGTNINTLLYSSLTFGTSTGVFIYPRTSQTKEDLKPKFENATIGFIAVLSFMLFLLTVGTAVDFVYQQKEEDGDNQSLPIRLILCFSVYTNIRKLFSVSSKGGSDHLGCLSGIRSISMAWVILGHSYLQLFYKIDMVKNRVDSIRAGNGERGLSFELVMNALPSVDTFFFMSGLLVCYLSLIQLEKKRFNIVLFYVHRYFRLTIPLAFAVGVVTYIFPLLGSGPFFPEYVHWNKITCEDHGWLNLIYMNNFFEQRKMCMGVTWYLANDMQFYWYAPLIIIPLWINQMVGLIVLAGNIIAFTIIPIVVAIYVHLPPINSIKSSDEDKEFIKGWGEEVDGYADVYGYHRPYMRFQPYLMGMALGYIFFKTRGKAIKIPKVLNLILWPSSLIIGFIVVLGTYPDRKNGYNIADPALYWGFARLAWSMALGWVIFSCVKGYGGIINSFLCWSPFFVMARLTYFMYLFHYDILSLIMSSIKFNFVVRDQHVIFMYMSYMVIVTLFAILATLAFEAPFIGLEKIILSPMMSPSKRSKEVNVVLKSIKTIDPEDQGVNQVKLQSNEEGKNGATLYIL